MALALSHAQGISLLENAFREKDSFCYKIVIAARPEAHCIVACTQLLPRHLHIRPLLHVHLRKEGIIANVRSITTGH